MNKLDDSPYFSLMPDQLKTNPSIISFQVWVSGQALDHDQLKSLFEAVCTAKHTVFDDGVCQVFFGQPVAYGDQSFIRLAIGANSIRRFLELDNIDLKDDFRLIQILEDYAERLFAL